MRTLNRQLTRRIGDMVITLSPNGVMLRKFRRTALKTARIITWQELLDIVGADPAKTRDTAFATEPEKRWMPTAGDAVYLSRKHRRGRGVVVSAIPALPEPLYLVQVGKQKTEVMEKADLRPAPRINHKPKKTDQQELPISDA